MAWVSQESYRAVGEALSSARKRAGVSQDELAKLLGKPQSFVSACERGQRRVDIVELGRIAKALHLEPIALFAALTEEARDAA